MFDKFRKRSSEITRLSDQLALVVETLKTKIDTSDDSDTTSPPLAGLRLRVEALEMSNEQLREECLRHLRKASQRMKRAEEIAEDSEAEPRAFQMMQPQLDFPEQAETDDRSWAADQIRKRGEIPI